jgi:hypothetical protein
VGSSKAARERDGLYGDILAFVSFGCLLVSRRTFEDRHISSPLRRGSVLVAKSGTKMG